MKAFAVVLIGVLAACGTDPGFQTGPIVPDVVGDTARVELRPGQSLVLDGVTLQFVAVEEDSRCPTDVTCVWEGNARVRLTASGEPGERTIEVNTALQPREAEYGGWTISIGGLSPQPNTERPTQPGEYALRLVLARAGAEQWAGG